MQERPNIVYFQVDNLGYDEPGCDGGGILRGAATPRIGHFAAEGFRLLNFAPEGQCRPSRAALLTGRHAIRTGTHTLAPAGRGGCGIVAWERTLGDLFAEAGYATMCMGTWHVGDGHGRWPIDHGVRAAHPGRRPARLRSAGRRKVAAPGQAGQLSRAPEEVSA